MNEIIFYNGSILTMEENQQVEAIFVQSGIIKKVGTTEEIMALQNNYTKLVDLQGHTLLPAFIDAHSHLTAFANTLRLASLSAVKSTDELVDTLRSFKETKQIAKGDWIVGFGYDNHQFVDKQHPTKHILDQVSIENPIFVSHASGHMGVANSLALQALHITSDTPDPEGGKIGREPNSSEPNGYLEENAFIQNSSKIPQPSAEEMCTLLEEAQQIYFSYGITTAQEGMVNAQQESLLVKMVKERRLLMDVVGYIDVKNSHELASKHKEYIGTYIHHYKIGGYKMFLDGSPQEKTAWMTKPYEGATDGYSGYPIYQDEEVEQMVQTAINENMQLLTHCNGDAAADQLLFTFAKLFHEQKIKDHKRPVMIHAQTVRPDQLAFMKRIHMIPSFFVEHTYYWGDTHLENLGEERAFHISPLKTAIENGVMFTLHQDTPVVPPDMLHTVWCAVNRVTKSGMTLGEDEKITPQEALKGVTIHGAYQYFEENKKGSIKPGKQANFVILQDNPLTIEPMQIKDISILETIMQGKTVFKKE